MALAKACDRPVAVDSELSEYRDVVAEPDGRMRVTAHVEPVRARNGSGDWAAIDTTLRKGADGRIGPVNAVVPVSISDGGRDAFALISDGPRRFGLTWPDALPEPSLSGPTATYADVLPGVDLTVTATATGFSHNLVVNSRDAADNPELARLTLGMDLAGLDARASAAGGVEVVDQTSGSAFLAAPQPMMWDNAASDGVAGGDVASRSAAEPGDPSSETAEVGVEVEPDALTLVPDAAMLTSSYTSFPVVIDPLWTGGKRDGVWLTVSDKFPGSAYWKTSHLLNKDDFGDAGAGRTCDSWTDFTCHTPSYRMRSYFRMNTEHVSRYESRMITSATFKLRQKHAWVCQDSSPLSRARIWRTSDFTTTTTWNDQPWWSGDYASSGANANYGAACPGGPATVEFDAKQMVQYAQDNRDVSVNIAMKAIDEGSVAQWKRFDSSTATLNIYYNTRPLVPVGRSADGAGCRSSGSPVWVTKKSPYFQSKVADADGSVRGQYQIYSHTGTKTDDHTTGALPSGSTAKWTTSKSLYESIYHWRVRGFDGSLYSDWSTYCYFHVDSIAPKMPTLKQMNSVDDMESTKSITLQLSSTDANGITKFEYGLDKEARTYSKSATNDQATITWSNLTPGRHMVYVWARDPAGHVSARGTKTFFLGSEFPDTSMAAWRLDGDVKDDSGQGNDLTVPSAVTFAPDRDGTGDSALAFPGTADACATTDSSVLQTDKAYTVAAWVRLGAGGGANPTVLSQAGTSAPAFYLQHEQATNRWRMILSSGDVASPSWQWVSSATAAAEGEWTHLAATVDPVAKVVRLYVDGELSNSAELTLPVWHASGPMHLGCAGSATDKWNEFSGAIDHVGAWQGLLSQAEIQRAATDLSAALVGQWQLAGSGTDTAGTDGSGNDLTPVGGYDWGQDQYGRTNGALVLDGASGSCASTGGSVLRTDDSFSVAAWAKLSSGGAQHPVVISQAGTSTSAFFLGWDTDVNKWTFIMPSADSVNGGETWARTFSQQPLTADKWQHVVGVYDADDEEIRLYVDGVEQDSEPVTEVWNAAGPLHVGCSMLADGQLGGWAKGSFSGAAAYRGAVSAEQIDQMFANPPVQTKGTWPLDGPGSFDPDPAGLRDVSGNGHDLSISGEYSWTDDRFVLPDGSLSLELGSGSCAETAGSVVRTDASFTVAAWVQLGDRSADRVVVSQAASQRPGFYLRYDHSANRWSFMMPSADTAAPTYHSVTSVQAPDADSSRWTHVAAVYDVAAGEMRLYVDGVWQGTADGPSSPWQASGPLLVGCAGATGTGSRSGHLGSAVDEVRVWSSTVDPLRINELAQG